MESQQFFVWPTGLVIQVGRIRVITLVGPTKRAATLTNNQSDQNTSAPARTDSMVALPSIDLGLSWRDLFSNLLRDMSLSTSRPIRVQLGNDAAHHAHTSWVSNLRQRSPDF